MQSLGLIVTNSAHIQRRHIRNSTTLERVVVSFFSVVVCKICSTNEVIEKNCERMTLIERMRESLFKQTPFEYEHVYSSFCFRVLCLFYLFDLLNELLF